MKSLSDMSPHSTRMPLKRSFASRQRLSSESTRNTSQPTDNLLTSDSRRLAAGRTSSSFSTISVPIRPAPSTIIRLGTLPSSPDTRRAISPILVVEETIPILSPAFSWVSPFGKKESPPFSTYATSPRQPVVVPMSFNFSPTSALAGFTLNSVMQKPPPRSDTLPIAP